MDVSEPIILFLPLADFVIPKFFKTKRYVVCPMIDMANHDSIKAKGEVAFEYFGNAYSLAIRPNVTPLQPNEQIYISYGPRNNDQLLQYYGFCEVGNPNDAYIMPSIREWDINALELACGRKFVSGRLQLLEGVGLLSGSRVIDSSNDDDDSTDRMSNLAGEGVVLSRAIGLDPAVLQAIRVLVSTEAEWNKAGQSIGSFSLEHSRENERCARLAAMSAVQMELGSKPTTIEDDESLLSRIDRMKNLDTDAAEKLALQFRIEKKKLLKEVVDMLNTTIL
jgi:Rubisco LSMT substrate-binding